MEDFKPRAKNINDLAQSTLFLFAARPLDFIPKAEKILTPEAKKILADVADLLESTPEWDAETLESGIKDFAERQGLKLGKVAQPIRAALTGSNVSPGIFDILLWLGKQESLARINDVAIV